MILLSAPGLSPLSRRSPNGDAGIPARLSAHTARLRLAVAAFAKWGCKHPRSALCSRKKSPGILLSRHTMENPYMEMCRPTVQPSDIRIRLFTLCMRWYSSASLILSVKNNNIRFYEMQECTENNTMVTAHSPFRRHRPAKNHSMTKCLPPQPRMQPLPHKAPVSAPPQTSG